MFSKREKRLLAQLVFEAWTSPTFATALLSDPQAVTEARGIRDHHGRKFQVSMDTENTTHLIVPWLPDDMRKNPDSLPPADKEAQVAGVLRVDWDKREAAQLFRMLRTVWTDPRVAAQLLEDPRKVLARFLSKQSLTKLGSQRIVAIEDSAAVVNLVVRLPPEELAKQMEEWAKMPMQPMCSASFCLCDDDDDCNGDDKDGDDKDGEDEEHDGEHSERRSSRTAKRSGAKRAARKKR